MPSDFLVVFTFLQNFYRTGFTGGVDDQLRDHLFWFCLIRNKAAQGQMTQGSRTECEDTVDSQTDSAEHGGFTRDIQHVILPQVQYRQEILALSIVRPPAAHI